MRTAYSGGLLTFSVVDPVSEKDGYHENSGHPKVYFTGPECHLRCCGVPDDPRTDRTGFLDHRHRRRRQQLDRNAKYVQTQANTQSQQSGTSREVRTVLRIGFKFPTASAAQQTGSLASANSLSLSRFSQNRPELAGVNVSLNGDGTAVLTGSLPTIESSRLAANLMRIQPGVRKIDNQIAVIQ